jgi:hypothetical protein
MTASASVKMRGAKVMSIEVGPKWTFIRIRVRTDSIAAQGTRRLFASEEGVRLRRKIREKSQSQGV